MRLMLLSKQATCMNKYCSNICDRVLPVIILVFTKIRKKLDEISFLISDSFSLVGFYGISTIVGYLIPNPLCTYILNIYDLVWFGFMAYQQL